MRTTAQWRRMGAILALSLATVSTLGNPAFTQKAAQGCPPSFWATHREDWVLTGYSPHQTVGSVFVAPPTLSNLEGATLLEALNFREGPSLERAVQVLLQEAIAALLNAVHPRVNYPTFSPIDVLRLTDLALTANRGHMLALAAHFRARNNQGCPL